MGAGSQPRPAPAAGAPHPTQPLEPRGAQPRRRHGAAQSVLQPPHVNGGAGDTGMPEGAGAQTCCCHPGLVLGGRRGEVLPPQWAPQGSHWAPWQSADPASVDLRPRGLPTPAPLPKGPRCPQEVLGAVGRRALRGPARPEASVGLEEGTWRGAAAMGHVVRAQRTEGRGTSGLL